MARQDKQTTIVHVVYDTYTQTTAGSSLNDCLHVGHKLNMNIFDILLRFRVHCIAIIADIEKAFLIVAQKDRDVLYFLWYADQIDLMELRFARVVSGMSSSPFLLNATIRHSKLPYQEVTDTVPLDC